MEILIEEHGQVAFGHGVEGYALVATILRDVFGQRFEDVFNLCETPAGQVVLQGLLTVTISTL